MAMHLFVIKTECEKMARAIYPYGDVRACYRS